MRNLLIICVLIASLGLLGSCKHKPQFATINPGDTLSTKEIPCDPDTVYFAEIQAIINSSCLHSGCHNSADHPGDVDLSSFDKILATADVVPGNAGESDLYEVLISFDPDKVMPKFPYDKLNADQIEKIRVWIQQGARNNYCDGCDTLSVTYSNQISTLIENYCASCHNDNVQQKGVNLSGYSNLKTYVDSGIFQRTINHDTGVVAMPYLQNKLDDCKIHTIEIWISDGAPNN